MTVRKDEKLGIDYEKFFAINLDLLCICELDGTLIKMNQEWENVLGYPISEMEGRKFLEYVHEEDLAATLEAMSDLGNHIPVYYFTNRYRVKDGSYRYIEWCSKVDDGYIYAAARDITDKMKKEAMLKEKEENFRTFFDTVNDLIFIATSEGAILHTNQAVTDKLGYSMEELSRMHVLDVHPAIYRSEAEVIFAEMFQGMRDYCPLPLRKKDGRFLPVETRVWFGQWNGQTCIYGISKDLSKQQAALERFHKMFDSNPALMAVSSIEDKKFIDVNTAFLDKLGYTREEILGKSSLELGLFLDQDKQLQIAEQLKLYGSIRNIELQVRKKDGSVLIGLFSGEVIDNQASMSFLTVMIDITEQKRNALEVEQQQRFLSSIIDAIPDAVFIKDKKSIYIGCNKAFADKIAGTSKEEVIGKSDYDFWGNSPLAQSYKQQDQYIIKTKMSVTNYHKRDARDQKKEYETVKTPLYDEAGEVTGIIGIARDISVRKMMEEKLKESEEKFRLLFENMTNGFSLYEMVCDEEGNPVDGKIVLVNRAYELQMGRTAEETVGKTFSEIIGNANMELLKRFSQVALTGEPLHWEFYSGKTNRYYNTFTFSPKKGMFASISEDVTERKEMEFALVKAKEQAEAANIMKSQFLANMSHEIRTPMNGILGYLDLLLSSELSFRQKEFAREAKAASELLLYLINDILDFSKIEAGKLQIEQTEFNIRKMVDEAVAFSYPKASEKKIPIHTQIDPEIPIKVIGDPARLKQIINNLLSNAIKFTEEGEISVKVDAGERSDNEITLYFVVKDSGIGISKEAIDQLFSPFTQADSSTTRKYGGTGLGLAICRQLVHMMNGDIFADSMEGKGSCFKFFVRLGYQAQIKQTPKGNQLVANILVISPQEQERNMIKDSMDPTCYRIYEAGNADSAIAIIMKSASFNPVQIVLTDYQLPEMNGYQFASMLQYIPAAENIAVIIAGTEEQLASEKPRVKKNSIHSLIKPFGQKELINSILHSYGQNAQYDLVQGNLDSFMKRSGISLEIATGLYRDYIHTASGMFEKIEMALRQGKLEEVANIAHQLKGISGTLNINIIFELARDLEQHAILSEPDACHKLFEEMKKQFH